MKTFKLHLAPQNNKTNVLGSWQLNPAILKIKCQHTSHENNSAGRQGPLSVLRRGKKKHGNDYQMEFLENTQSANLFKGEKLNCPLNIVRTAYSSQAALSLLSKDNEMSQPQPP